MAPGGAAGEEHGIAPGPEAWPAQRPPHAREAEHPRNNTRGTPALLCRHCARLLRTPPSLRSPVRCRGGFAEG